MELSRSLGWRRGSCAPRGTRWARGGRLASAGDRRGSVDTRGLARDQAAPSLSLGSLTCSGVCIGRCLLLQFPGSWPGCRPGPGRAPGVCLEFWEMVITITGDPAWLIFNCIRNGERPVSAQAGPLEEGAWGRGSLGQEHGQQASQWNVLVQPGGPGFSVGLGGASQSALGVLRRGPGGPRARPGTVTERFPGALGPRTAYQHLGPGGGAEPSSWLVFKASTTLSVFEKAKSEGPREPCSSLLELECVLESAADADPESCGARPGLQCYRQAGMWPPEELRSRPPSVTCSPLEGEAGASMPSRSSRPSTGNEGERETVLSFPPGRPHGDRPGLQGVGRRARVTPWHSHPGQCGRVRGRLQAGPSCSACSDPQLACETQETLHVRAPGFVP